MIDTSFLSRNLILIVRNKCGIGICIAEIASVIWKIEDSDLICALFLLFGRLLKFKMGINYIFR